MLAGEPGGTNWRQVQGRRANTANGLANGGETEVTLAVSLRTINTRVALLTNAPTTEARVALHHVTIPTRSETLR